MNPVSHVAIIMDGNGRWGKKNKNSRKSGHKAGLKTVETIIQESLKKKIKYLTLYAFSTENWKRPIKEVNFLFRLLEEFLIKKTDKLNKNGIRLKIIGSKTPFTQKLKKILNKSEKITLNNKELQINLALNYGFKSELLYAIKKINKSKIPITENNINKNLYTKNIPDPDLLIRTGNTKRLSNFLLWQLAYSELFFVDKMWPEFKKKDYEKIIQSYKQTKRNFGSL